MNGNYTIQDSDVEKFIESGLITSLRYMLYLDDRFRWDFDARNRDIDVVTEFPNREQPLKENVVIVTGLNWNGNNMSSLNQDIAEPINTEDGIHVGDKYRTVINFSCTVLCEAEGMRSKDIGNKVANILMFTGKEVLAKNGITIYNINKGVTGPKAQTPTKVFSTPISVSGSVTWVGIFKYKDVNDMNLLDKIKIKVIVEGSDSAEDRKYVGPDVYISEE